MEKEVNKDSLFALKGVMLSLFLKLLCVSFVTVFDTMSFKYLRGDSNIHLFWYANRNRIMYFNQANYKLVETKYALICHYFLYQFSLARHAWNINATGASVSIRKPSLNTSIRC